MGIEIKSTEYLAFAEQENPGRKTRVVQVQSVHSGITLGEIRWYGPWRQYVFHPANNVIFNSGCLSDIELALKELGSWQRRKRLNA